MRSGQIPTFLGQPDGRVDLSERRPGGLNFVNRYSAEFGRDETERDEKNEAECVHSEISGETESQFGQRRRRRKSFRLHLRGFRSSFFVNLYVWGACERERKRERGWRVF